MRLTVVQITVTGAPSVDASDMKKQVVLLLAGFPLLWMPAVARGGNAAQAASSREVGDVIASTGDPPTEAPAGFDDATNGMVDDTTHAADKEAFDGAEDADEGLGPLYNAQACRECHQAPVSGAASQITELRIGHRDSRGNFVDPDIPMGDGTEVVHARSLLNDRSICPNAEFPDLTGQQRAPASENIRALRASLNTLGDGFIEAIPSDALRAARRPAVPAHERGDLRQGDLRAGHRGRRHQARGALRLEEPAREPALVLGRRVPERDGHHERARADRDGDAVRRIQDPEDEIGADGLGDVDRFARFMRASKAPPRYASVAASADSVAGSDLFDQVGCAICHVRTFTTAPAGSVLNGGTLVVSEAVGNKIIHPFSDFLLHDIGTGDGIVQNGGQGTAQHAAHAAALGPARARADDARPHVREPGRRDQPPPRRSEPRHVALPRAVR